VLNLELNHNQKAIEIFKQLTKSNNLDAFKGHWYLALAYLKISKNELALQELKTLTKKTKIFKNKEALALIKNLE